MKSEYMDIREDVESAIKKGAPVVALESTIISHGMPYPKNVETALKVESLCRSMGVIPATMGIIEGKLKAGLTNEEIDRLGKAGEKAVKTSRRDIPFVVAKKLDGATTVAATMIMADMAGIKIFATGGIGGVHRGAAETFDVSADLQELARTDIAVICAGPKSILDIGLTLEYLETLGVPVVGFGTDELPAFYTRKSGFGVDYRVDSSTELALFIKTKHDLMLHGGMVIANPVPEAEQMPPDVINKAISIAIDEMNKKGIKGKAATPFLLAKVSEITGGDSLETNIKLVLNNVNVACKTAIELSKLMK